jgi:hypothetical protein
MKSYRRLGEVVAATLLLLAPAMWNGFPFLQYDSGGYLARWFEGYLEPSRSTVYGLVAVVGWPLDFWPASAPIRHTIGLSFDCRSQCQPAHMVWVCNLFHPEASKSVTRSLRGSGRAWS